MRKKILMSFAILFFVSLTTFLAFAQPSVAADQGTPSGPGYGMDFGEGYGPCGPGNRYGMGPGMMGPEWHGGYGMGPGMMVQGWGGGYGMGPGMMGPGYGYGMGPWMFFFMLIFLVLVIVGVVLLVRYLSPHAKTKPSEGALEILKHRYARGEIQKAEFEEKRKDLQS